MADRIPALSIWRPWPKLIMAGHKPIENRGWTTRHRGDMWIHGARRWQDLDLQWLEDRGINSRDYEFDSEHPTGILGLVDLVEVCDAAMVGETCDCGPWAAQLQYHWRLANPRPLAKVVAAPGKQGLWWPVGEVAAQLQAVGA